MSAASLVDPLLVDHLAAMLASAGVPARRLAIEITESAFINDLAV